MWGPFMLNRRERLAMIFTTMLLVLTLPTMLLLIGPLGGWIFLRVRCGYERRNLQSYIGPAVVGSIAGAMFYASGFVTGGLSQFSSRFGVNSVSTLLRGLIPQMSLPYLMPVLLIGAFIGLFIGWRRYSRFLSVLTTLLVTAIVLAFVQDLLTGRVLFPRNYTYLSPFLALLVAVGWMSLLSYVPHPDIATALILMIVAVFIANDTQRLDEETTVDRWQIAIEDHAQDGDLLLIGCCLDYPTYYLYRHSSLFGNIAAKDRYVFVPTAVESFETLTEKYSDYTVSECEAAQWNEFDVMICQPSAAEESR